MLVQGGIIRAVGPKLLTPPGVRVFDANGKSLTPGLFAGFSDIGLEEVSAEKSSFDSSIELAGTGVPQTRPEFDVTLAYNPASMVIPVARMGGLTFTALTANSGGSLIAGQGDVVRLDGDPLEVSTLAEAVWMHGTPMPLRSRQTQLRDRYLQDPGTLPRAYSR